MKNSRRMLRGLVLAAMFGTAALLGVGAAPPPPAQADVSDFSYDRWDVDYRIGVDDAGRAVARVTETLTARFPDYDQNRGLVRGLPDDYEGASTDPRDFSVTDASGAPVPFEVEHDDGFTAVLTGDDSYVHGVQTYVIEYTLSDVILARDDGEADEFYWDLTDFEHRQRIDAFSAEIEFSPELAARLNGDARCYSGPAESTDECGVTGGEGGFRISVPGLGPGEGVTVAIGLEPGSVEQPPQRLPAPLLDVLPLVVSGAGLAAGAAGLFAIGGLKRKKRKSGRGTVVAQYDVPRSLPPLIAASVAGTSTSAPAAEIVHLAVSGAIRIEEGEETRGLFGPKQGQPVLRVLDPARAEDPLDRTTMRHLFATLEPGVAFELPQKDDAFGKRMSELASMGGKEALQRGYFTKERSPAGRVLGFVALGLAVVIAVLTVLGFASGRESAVPVIGIIAGFLSFAFGIAAISKQRVYTPVGAEWREYLEGVELFIKVAEADRLQMLQSYQGAERRQDGTVDVIELYEKLLPYAMLFNLEKEWSRVLEVKYREQPGYVPVWYPGVAAHGIGDLTSTISSFTSSLTSSVSYTSSSSGGSSGGGFSGGGGGGGFSGGR
ncbi:DUF2207 domain-containing protein [Leucobacter sp. CSA1]|uniref:DUF2207 domain-containing protein n=1 Tax=Leucobacter chromiisoli TaxID=2796471 RepID=A0A934Q698_9MICO|nr:DUF2207 domain-containing protein [Leucobacter chromiisoli]MBK0418183.1 DUF2207 domain-containing protein [Leucobacter chromiisoli]